MAGRQIVLFGMMTKYPVGGVIWQTLHYLVGFRRLGYDVYYVEAGGLQPAWMIAKGSDTYGAVEAAAFIDHVMRRFDLGDKWAFHALHYDGEVYGLSRSELLGLYSSAELLINLHGSTVPLPEHSASGRLVYLETDPVALQAELANGEQEAIDFLSAHVAFFTFGENYGNRDCEQPVSDRFQFHPTRQPVVRDLWGPNDRPRHSTFTTIGNWKQPWRDVTIGEDLYTWSKNHEFLKIIDLPARVDAGFELALARCDGDDQRFLERHGWHVVDALAFSTDIDAYRQYIVDSYGEFTVAKDQNIRLRTGWFSDRAACYLAAGRPVINQDTGFTNVLPTGEGLLAFSTMDEIVRAVEDVNNDYDRHSRAALHLAREYFNYDVVLPDLLAHIGLPPRSPVQVLT